MDEKQRTFDLAKCVRPNILAIPAYTTMRDDYPEYKELTLLDANENSFGPCIPMGESVASGSGHGSAGAASVVDFKQMQLQRYPDASQTELKQLFCDFRNTACEQHHSATESLRPENVCLGVGSDELIDAIIRVFCTPGKDKLLFCPPTYGMYQVSARVNDVATVEVNLDAENGFGLRSTAINKVLAKDPLIKVAFICSPANPTGNIFPVSDIVQILESRAWNGVVVVDEAYVDFAPCGSLATHVNQWPNLIVIQTLSKAFGLAGTRLGVAFAQPQISRLLNNVVGPYKISAPTIALATAALQPDGIASMKLKVEEMAVQRARLIRELPLLPGFGGFLGGQEVHTNFLLVQFLDKPVGDGAVPDNATAEAVAQILVAKAGILVRFRGNEPGCVGSLRITVGTREEVDNLLAQLRLALVEVYRQGTSTAGC